VSVLAIFRASSILAESAGAILLLSVVYERMSVAGAPGNVEMRSSKHANKTEHVMIGKVRDKPERLSSKFYAFTTTCEPNMVCTILLII
jgi:hypothetical protein